MSSFDEAIGFVLENEGGYADNPDDPGGETRYGISKRAYPDIDIKNLTVAQAEQIYERDYWNPLWASIDTQDIATKLLDLVVNLGEAPGVKIVQRSAGTVPDGIFGQHTLEAINSTNPGKLLREIRARQAVYYAETVIARPASASFLLGWMRRAVK